MLNKLPDFNRLYIFYHIYLKHSITGAAEEVRTSPSAVSQQLSKLEDELGVKLFSRPHKRLVATSAGLALFETLKPFIASLVTTVAQVRAAKIVPAGILKIGAPVEFGKIFVPKMIADFRIKYPDVTFFLQIGRTSELLPLVQSGELDFAFVDTFPAKRPLQGEWTGINLQPVFEETVVLACSENYSLRKLDGDYSYQNLLTQDFIAQQQDASAIRNWFYHIYRKKIQEIKVVLTVANHQAVINAIRCDLGLGIIVAQLVGNEIAEGRIHVVDAGRKNPVNRVSLLQLMDKVPSLAEKTFQKHVLNEMQRQMPFCSIYRE